MLLGVARAWPLGGAGRPWLIFLGVRLWLCSGLFFGGRPAFWVARRLNRSARARRRRFECLGDRSAVVAPSCLLCAGSAVVIDQTDQLRRVPAVYCGRARSFSIRARGHSKLRHTSLCFCNFFYPSGRRRAGPSPARDALEMYLRRAARCRALTQPASVKAIAAVYAAAGLGAQLNSVSKGPS